MRHLALCLSLFIVACRQSDADVAIVRSRCVTDAECEEEARCDLTRQQCFRARPEVPYDVVLQVYAQAEGVSLVEQHNHPFKLTAARENERIVVPESVPVMGGVTRNGDTGLESEVTFTPRISGAVQGRTIIVNTRGGNEVDNLRTRLNPATSYDVRIQPLLDASKELPPLTDVYDGPEDARIDYAPMASRTANLVDQNLEPVHDGPLVRLEHKTTSAVLSSTTQVENGSFTLFADDDVLTGQDFYVAVSLKEFSPWRVKVLIDGAQLVEGATMTMPTVPELVTQTGSVSVDEASGIDERVPFAQISFVSTFPVPDGQGALGDLDWCKWRFPENADVPLLCQARVTTTADEQGRFSIALLPGTYDIFASPSSQSPGAGALATSPETHSVETPSDGSQQQGGKIIRLQRAARYRGRVRAADGRAMPNVTVTARALSLPANVAPPDSIGEVARYNRTATAITDQSGRFELAVDQGYFDLLIEPPPDSGFAWVGSLAREISASAGDQELPDIIPPAPVYVAGTVGQEADESPLSGARIEAYALVPGLTGGQRAVRIGRTTSDATGAFRLALPPVIGDTP